MPVKGRPQHIKALEKGNNATLEVGKPLETKLTRIAELAKRRPRIKLQTLIHVIDERTLEACHGKLEANKAIGIDGVTKYGVSDNIQRLKAYRYIIRRKLFGILNRRSQRKSFSWGKFAKLEEGFPLAKAKIYVNTYG